MTTRKLLALLLFLVLFVACLLFFLHQLSFEDTLVVLVGDIGAYFTLSELLA